MVKKNNKVNKINLSQYSITILRLRLREVEHDIKKYSKVVDDLGTEREALAIDLLKLGGIKEDE